MLRQHAARACQQVGKRQARRIVSAHVLLSSPPRPLAPTQKTNGSVALVFAATHSSEAAQVIRQEDADATGTAKATDAALQQQAEAKEPTPLQQLARRILRQADFLAAEAARLSHPPRSMIPSPSVPARLLPEGASPKTREQQDALRDALGEALILATDASEVVPDLAVRNNQFASLRWLLHFDIVASLPLDAEPGGSLFQSVPYADVAEKTGVPEHQLRSTARMAMLQGFLSEPRAGRLAHSPLSAAMAALPDLVGWAKFITSTSAPMVGHMVEATERWGSNTSPTKTAYAAAWGTEEQTLFAHIASVPELHGQYAAYMRAMTQSEGMALDHLIRGWSKGWEALATRKGAVLFDVGGSTGHASIALARAYPGLRAIVQDRVEVVARARREMEPSLEAEGLPVTFQAHDFFRPQPEARPVGFERADVGAGEGPGDVYVLRQILHDWDDGRCVTILGHLAARLAADVPRGRIVIMDTVLPAPSPPSTAGSPRTKEALLRVRDLTMLQAHNAHERSHEEWEVLLESADPALEIQRVEHPFKSLMSIIEVAYRPGRGSQWREKLSKARA